MVASSTLPRPPLSNSTNKNKNHKNKNKKSREKKKTKEDRKELIKKIEEYVGQQCHNITDAMQILEAHTQDHGINIIHTQDKDTRTMKEMISQNKKRDKHTGSLLTMNMRGAVETKLKGLDMLELWNVINKYEVVSAGLQDHQLYNSNTAVLKEMRCSAKIFHEHSNQAISQGHRGLKSDVVGGTALFSGGVIAANTTCKPIIDERGWGRMSGRIIQGEKDDYDTTNLAIISCYVPCKATGAGGAWETQTRKLIEVPDGERQKDPRAQGLYDLKKLKEKLEKDHKCNVIIMGDFNIDLNKSTTKRANLLQWSKDTGMVNATLLKYGHDIDAQIKEYDQIEKDDEQKIYTWIKSTKEDNKQKSYIDHVWVSAELYTRGCVLGSAVMKEQVANSDHRPLITHIDFTEALGLNRSIDKEEEQRRRIFKYVNQKQRKIYESASAKIWKKKELRKRIEEIYKRAVEGTLKQEEMDEVMKMVVAALLEAEESIDENLPLKKKKKYRQGWSAEFMNKLKTLTKYKTMITHSSKNRLWEAKQMADIINLKYSDWLRVAPAPSVKAGKAIWKKWETNTQQAVKDMRKTMHLKHRIEFRKQISTFAAAIEKSRLESKTCKKFYTYISDSTFTPPSRQLYINKEWVRGSVSVKEAEEHNLSKHMSGRTGTFHYDTADKNEEADDKRLEEDIVTNPFCALNKRGVEMRKALADPTSDDTEWKEYVPKETHTFFKLGEKIIDSNEYGDIFSSGLNFEKFVRYLGYKSKNKSPSESHVRLDHICGLQENELRDVCTLLSVPYVLKEKMTYTSWNNEIISWIPKEPGNPAIDRRRPIALLEVMRKLCLGAKKNEVFNVWIKHGAIDKDNFAFMKGKTTTDAILIKRLMLEDAKMHKKSLITLDIDYKAAFDKVPYFIKEMSLRRLGVPEEGIKLWCIHDKTRKQKVRTAYGLTEGIHPYCGAFGQGAEESPMGFVSLMSWKCDFIEQTVDQKDPYMYNTGTKKVALTKTLFCDDSSYSSSSMRGARALAYAVGIFSAAAGMELNLKKSFWVSMNCPSEGQSIAVPIPQLNSKKRKEEGRWEYDEIKMQEIEMLDVKTSWRHLGNYQDNNCSPLATAEEINKDISEVITYMSKRMLTSEGILVGYKTKCMPRLLYKLKHANLNKKQLQKAQVRINGMLKEKLRIPLTTPNLLLYGHRSGGGLEFPHLWDETNIQKLTILQTGLTKQGSDLQSVLVGAIRRLQQWSKLDDDDIQSKKMMMLDLDKTAWISSLWKWMYEHDYKIELPRTAKNKKKGATILGEYIDYEIRSMTKEQKEKWKMLCTTNNYDDTIPQELRHVKKRINKIAVELRKHNLHYIEDLGDDERTNRRQKSVGKRAIKRSIDCFSNQKSNNRWVEMLLKAGIINSSTKEQATGQLGIQSLTVDAKHKVRNIALPEEDDIIRRLEETGFADEICGDMKTVRELEDEEPQQGEIYTYTDGSVLKKDDKLLGSFGWIIPSRNIQSEDDIIFAGGGREVMQEQEIEYGKTIAQLPQGEKMSSTRMEAAAILSLHIAISKMDPEILLEVHNGIDSQSALQTYNKIVHMQPHDVLKIQNHDIWMIIKAYQETRIINMYHVPAHMDKHIKDAMIEAGEKPTDQEVYDILTQEWKGNYHADEQADRMHTEGTLIPQGRLGLFSPTNIQYKDNIVTVALQAWARTNVQCSNSKQYWEYHNDWTEGINIDWKCLVSVTKAHSQLYKRVAFMKTLWSTYSYSNKRMEWRLIPPSEGKCIFCNEKVETQQHVLCECQGERMKETNSQMYHEIAEVLIKAVTPKEGVKLPKRKQLRLKRLREWIPKMIPKLWKGEMSDITTKDAIVDRAISNLTKVEMQATWRGVMPVQLTKLVSLIVDKHSTAQRAAKDISVIVQDQVTNVWKETCRLRAESEVPAGYTTRDYAKMLHDKGLLLSETQTLSVINPITTLEGYRGLPKRFRNNIVAKRLRELGIQQGEPIPKEGDVIRHYTYPGKCNRSIVGKVNYKSAKCKVHAMLNVSEAATQNITSERLMQDITKHIVDDDGTTMAERDLCNRYTVQLNDMQDGMGVHSIHRNISDKKVPIVHMIRDDATTVDIPLDVLISTRILTKQVARVATWKSRRTGRRKRSPRKMPRSARTQTNLALMLYAFTAHYDPFKNKGNSYTAEKSLEGVEKDIDLTGITARRGPNDTARRPNAKNDTTINPIAAVEGEAAAVAAAGSLADSLGPDD